LPVALFLPLKIAV